MLHNFRGHLKAFKYLIQLQEQFSVDIAHNDSFHKTPFQRIAAGTSATTIPILLKFLLGAGPISYEKATEVWLELGGPMTLLLGSARRLSAICQYADSIGAELAFISELAIAGADLHVQDFSGATPLDHILNTWSVRTFPEINKERILLEWLGCLSCSGIDLHRYCRKEEELHQDGKLVPVSIYRRNIDRVFTVYYGASPDDVTVLVEDVWRKSASLYNLPGSWDSELEYAERRRLNLIEGHSPSAFWSVTTAGFRDGDYSPKRASCTERITMFGRYKYNDTQ
jgi:hypothetical protein